MNIDLAEPIVTRESARFAHDWPGIEADDIAQEMWARLAESWGSIEAEPIEDHGRLVTYRARGAATAYCVSERHYFQSKTAQWIYTPSEVRALLADHYFQHDSWNETPKRPEWGKQTLLGDGVVVALWDIQNAFHALSEQDQVIIIRAYSNGERLNVTERKWLQRAMDTMTLSLNRGIYRKGTTEYEGPGSRKAISNAQSRAATTNDYYL